MMIQELYKVMKTHRWPYFKFFKGFCFLLVVVLCRTTEGNSLSSPGIFGACFVGLHVTSGLSIPSIFPSKTAKRIFQMSPDGSYFFAYDTGPGEHQSFREEKRNKVGVIAGSYGYVDPDGTLRITEYIADSKGYRSSLDVYEPVHQIPSEPPLIVGPLPPGHRQINQKLQKENKESVFDRYDFPLEPFERPETGISPNVSGSITTNSSSAESNETLPLSNGGIDTNEDELFSNRVDSNEIPLPVVEFATLQTQLKNVSKHIQGNSILLIGPIPEELQDINEKYSSKTLNSEEEAIRTLRSPERNFGPKNFRFSSNQKVFPKYYKKRRRDEFEKVRASISDLNYFERHLVERGEEPNNFLTLPSSNFLQGNFIDANASPKVLSVSLNKSPSSGKSINKLLKRRIKIKNYKLKERNKLSQSLF